MIKSDEDGEGEEGEEEEEDLMGDQSWAKTSADDFSGAVDDMFADLLNFKGPPASPTSGPCPRCVAEVQATNALALIAAKDSQWCLMCTQINLKRTRQKKCGMPRSVRLARMWPRPRLR